MKGVIIAIACLAVGGGISTMYEWINLHIPWLGPLLLAIGIILLPIGIFWHKIRPKKSGLGIQPVIYPPMKKKSLKRFLKWRRH